MNPKTDSLKTPAVLRPLAQLAACLALMGALPLYGPAQTLDPYYQSSYNLRDVGAVPDLPLRYCGLTLKAGDPNTLLIGGDAEDPSAQIYQIALVRDATGHISGFSGSVKPFAAAPGLPGSNGGMDAGLIYGPDNVLFYTSYSDNSIGQIKSGQTSVSKQTDLNTIGIPNSPGGLVLVPAGLPGAGRLKILTFNDSMWYDTTLSPDGSGTFNLAPVSRSVLLGGGMGLEGAFYVAAGNPQFPKPSVLVADWNGDRIVSFEVDANGDPLPETQRVFATDMNSVDGAAVDPLTGDFLFSSFSKGLVWVIGRLGLAGLTVTITSPVNNSTFGAPAFFRAWADASQPGGSIDEVDFYVDGVYSGRGNGNGSYTAEVGSLAAGIHALTAVALGSGMSTTSSVVNVIVTNVPPRVAIASPADYTFKNECAEVLLSATTGDGSGTVTNITYYLNSSTLLDSRPHPPYWLIASLPIGTNVLSAVATDDSGSRSTSAVVRVIFTPTPANSISANLMASGDLKLCFRGLINTSYVLESAASLSSPVWIPFTTNTAGQAASGLISVLQIIQSAYSTKFYRARAE
jgi:Bacterial Ig domain